jgi:protein arginine kinase
MSVPEGESNRQEQEQGEEVFSVNTEAENATAQTVNSAGQQSGRTQNEHPGEKERLQEITSKWMKGMGPEEEIVISSRIRLARNINGLPFPPLASDAQREKMLALVHSVLQEQSEHFTDMSLIHMGSLSSICRQVLVDKHLISPLQMKECHAGAVILRADEVISIMVNEEDHLRIQCLLPGLQLERGWREASRYDDYLEQSLDYAFHEELGYLTTCPTNVGTGLRASVMLYLSALAFTGQLTHFLTAVNQVGLVVRGIYGEGSEMVGGLCQISNQITLGHSEEEIWQNLYSVIRQLINQEKKARQQLLNQQREKLADRAGRAYGILKHARLLDAKETMQLISDVRLGVDLGLLRQVPLEILNELLTLISPGCLQYLKGRNLSPYELNLERAIRVKQCLP